MRGWKKGRRPKRGVEEWRSEDGGSGLAATADTGRGIVVSPSQCSSTLLPPLRRLTLALRYAFFNIKVGRRCAPPGRLLRKHLYRKKRSFQTTSIYASTLKDNDIEIGLGARNLGSLYSPEVYSLVRTLSAKYSSPTKNTVILLGSEISTYFRPIFFISRNLLFRPLDLAPRYSGHRPR